MNVKPRKDHCDERDEPLASEDEIEHEVSWSCNKQFYITLICRMTLLMWSHGKPSLLCGREKNC